MKSSYNCNIVLYYHFKIKRLSFATLNESGKTPSNILLFAIFKIADFREGNLLISGKPFITLESILPTSGEEPP